MHRESMNSTMNNSLCDMLDGMDLVSPGASAKEGNTVSTKDSIRKSSSLKKTKRGTKKESSKRDMTMLVAHPEADGGMENSLSDLLNCGEHLKSPQQKTKESLTVSTMDSIAKKDKKESVPKKSRRGGKKSEGQTEMPEKPKKSDLGSSLSDLLVDDDDDDYEPSRKSKESLTVSTMDSIQREKEKSSSSSSKKSSKRGGKKSSSTSTSTSTSTNKDGSSSLSLRGGPAPSATPTLGATLSKLGGPQRDFGRHADDNDTFCGLGTVGEKELSRGSPSKSNAASSSPKKTKIQAPPMKPKGKAMAASPFMMSSNNDDSDSEDEEDLFQGFSGASNNPFRMPSYL